MKITTTLRYTLARMLVKAAGFSIVPSWAYRSFLMPAFSSLVSEGVRKNAVYFACLEAHAFSFPEPPLLVYADDTDSAPPLPNHPIRKLLMQPNADMGEDQLQAAIIVWMALGGNCYLHKLRNADGQVIGLRPYHDGAVCPVPSDDPKSPSWVKRYDFRQPDGQLKPIDRADVIHLKWPVLDPDQPWMAQPPILAAAREVDADNEATRYVGALLQNDAIPRTIIEQSDRMALTPEERLRMKAEWSAEFGHDNRGGIAVLEPGVKVNRLSLDMQELNFSALHDIPEQRICAVMRVPAVVAGLGDDPTYANSEQAFKRYTLATLVPLWASVASGIQAGLAEDFGNDVVVRHHLGRVQALQEDETAKWGRVNTAFGSGWLGFGEARAAVGLPSEPKPDELFATSLARSLETFKAIQAAAIEGEAPAPPTPTAPTTLPALPGPTDQQPADQPTDQGQPAGQVADQPKGRPGPSEGKARPAAVARSLQRVRLRLARKMESAVADYFSDLAERVVARAQDAGKQLIRGPLEVDQPHVNGDGDAQEILVKMPIYQKAPTVADLLLRTDETRLRELFRTYTVELVAASWETWNQALDLDVAFEQSDPAVVAALKQSASRVTKISETTRQAIQEVLSFGASEGWSLEQLINGVGDQAGLRDVVAETYKNRHRNIARTELGEAQQACAVERFDSAGVSEVLVLDNGQDDPDEECKALNGTVQTLAWARKNTLGHPQCTRCFAPQFDS